MQLLFTSPSGTTTSGDVIIEGAFHYDPVSGSDSNNGILVGETGSGTTLNGTAGTGARQTESQFRIDMAAGRYSPGDLIYIRPPGFIFTAGFVMNSNSTVPDANNKVVIRSLPGEKANTVLDTETNGESSMLINSGGVMNCSEANLVIQSFRVACRQQPFGAGAQLGVGAGWAHGCQWVDLDFEYSNTAYLPDNGGNIKLISQINNFLIAGCTANAGGSNNANNGVIYYIGDALVGTIEFCDLGVTGGPGCDIHHKRSVGIVSIGDILIQRNFLRGGGGRGTFHGAGTARHRLLGNIHRSAISWGDSGTTDPGCFEMEFIHETFMSGLELDVVTTSSPSGEDNLVRDCILASPLSHWPGQGSPVDTGLTSNYNHFPSGTAVDYFDTPMNLATWQANAVGDVGQDADSVSEAIDWEGTPSAAGGPSSHRLAATSAGKNAASDGTDIGADVDNCGPSAMPTNRFWINGTTKRS